MPRTTAPLYFPEVRAESAHIISDLLLAGWEDAEYGNDTALRMDLSGPFGDWVLYIDRKDAADREHGDVIGHRRFMLYMPGADDAVVATDSWDGLAPYVGCNPDGARSILPAAFREFHADYSAGLIDGDARRCREARQRMAALSMIMDRWNVV
jgi:hypothetical protein